MTQMNTDKTQENRFLCGHSRFTLRVMREIRQAFETSV